MDSNMLLNHDTNMFLDALKQRPDVVGIILFGSWARGNNRPDSDVDLIVILTAGFKRTVEYHNQQAFEIIYTTANSALAFWESQRDDCAGLWAVAKVLLDKDGTIKRLQTEAARILQDGKQPHESDQVKQFRFDAEDQLRYVGAIHTSDPITAHMLLNDKVFMLTGLFFDLRLQWTPAPKQRLASINRINPAFYTLLETFYLGGLNITEKITLIHQMIAIVFDTIP